MANEEERHELFANVDAITGLLQNLTLTHPPSAFTKCSTCLFSTTPSHQSTKKKRLPGQRVDPYRLAQARQRKAANLARRDVLQQERKAAMGDPVHSQPTPFVESLRPGAPIDLVKESYLNFFVKPEELTKTVEHSKWLTEPPTATDGPQDPQRVEAARKAHEDAHLNASKSLAAIAALENGNSKDRTRVNFARCVEAFGRHNTDTFLQPKPISQQAAASFVAQGQDALDALDDASGANKVPKRVGPDTGSSEVQIAILTTKINVLADNLHKNDKHNKRNLRLLVHKRQKLLRYLWRKERAGPRWQNLVDKLGISDAMWKGEISL